jgi:hypothetical protein
MAADHHCPLHAIGEASSVGLAKEKQKAAGALRTVDSDPVGATTKSP